MLRNYGNGSAETEIRKGRKHEDEERSGNGTVPGWIELRAVGLVCVWINSTTTSPLTSLIQACLRHRPPPCLWSLNPQPPHSASGWPMLSAAVSGVARRPSVRGGHPVALNSSMPSAMLEQEAHTLGLRERTLPCSSIRSPQHTQIRDFMAIAVCQCRSIASGCP